MVEPLRRGDPDYFFAYPEDHSRQSVEWVNGEFDRHAHNPAFNVVFVYLQEEGTLDMKSCLFKISGRKKSIIQYASTSYVHVFQAHLAKT
uniref:Uncharacterized protein n=1 Tax=Candidatus Kentrum sp. TUN TaxID=2126343 RepID=A0A450ZLE2_9GAMM|nr:MAG: hypothetical protein BECKTUN1418F_GA0071002_104618 [Candidatus Kentron sp. TUN]VFK56847.1 MAG: hypothetical protein BECKTUN1418E_GA0071001_104318 [Candidatus Kentron sp. TUN]